MYKRQALVLSVLMGLAATWTNSKLTCDFLGEFQNIVLDIVGKIIIPMLPFYIAATFCNLSYEGMITHQLPAFIQIILIVMAGHYIWLAVLYLLAGAYSGKNPWEVLRHYGPAYLTAVGTMSSAATLAVALDCARKSKVLRKDMVSFGIPLFANIHLCGSVPVSYTHLDVYKRQVGSPWGDRLVRGSAIPVYGPGALGRCRDSGNL